jgi:acyl-CoA dehydrogenase
MGTKINGSKTFITNGGTANFIMVVAKTDPRAAPRAPRSSWSRQTVWKVSAAAATSTRWGLSPRTLAELFFDDMCALPADANMLGTGRRSGLYRS